MAGLTLDTAGALAAARELGAAGWAAAELLLVLEGAIRAAGASYAAGDFLQLTSAEIRNVSALEDQSCLCLVVGDDRLFSGATSRG